MNIVDTKQLLKATSLQFQHQQELSKIKGETFNIFSILNLETKEVKTHSRFLAELLNPEGSHMMGDAFLKVFLEKIAYAKPFNTAKAKVFKEIGIGLKTKNSGGSIDILIKDKETGETITIENKIYAGDQENQVLRYCNYNKSKNTVFYLTLGGTEPSETSRRDLEVHKDFYLISYNTTILKWLYRCQEIAIDTPQLREGIKQYYLLIKKLTHQMINPNDISMKKLLFEHSEASQYIADNFQNVKNQIKEQFREDVVKELKLQLDTKLFDFAYPNKVSNKGIAQIFIELKELSKTKVQILIESFSGYGHHNGAIFIGVLDHSNTHTLFPLSGEVDGFDTDWWKSIHFLKLNDQRIRMEDPKFLERLIDPASDKYKQTLAAFVNQCIDFINEKYPVIVNYFKESKISKGVDSKDLH